VHADASVTQAWETALEIDNTGFNLYRAAGQSGPFTRINDALIPAEGDAASGASYRFVDTPGKGIFRYLLEAVDTAGVGTLFGPIEASIR
jgi:hypothetical protein